jgi:hypothetical protein
MRKRYCNFCGEPMQDAATECKQCGWDRSKDGPPSSDPADQKARVGVAAGLAVAYGVMWILIQASPDVALATPSARPADAASQIAIEPVGQAVVSPAVAIGAPAPMALASTPAGKGAAKALTIKVADDKAAHIQAHDALTYDFVVPETDQKCRLVGQLHGAGGFDRDLETLLLTDDDYIFWRANTAAIPHSSWDTFRGSETTLGYDLPGTGTYHLVISNEMSPAAKTVQVKAQVKCASEKAAGTPK